MIFFLNSTLRTLFLLRNVLIHSYFTVSRSTLICVYVSVSWLYSNGVFLSICPHSTYPSYCWQKFMSNIHAFERDYKSSEQLISLSPNLREHKLIWVYLRKYRQTKYSAVLAETVSKIHNAILSQKWDHRLKWSMGRIDGQNSVVCW